jgi:DNA invertase Pin-like site-specific DNA recombinase
MANGKYVSYYRVSTRKQGKSGLGLEAQQQAVQVFLTTGNWKTMVGEFVEVESGKRADRPKLAEALALCRIYSATLVIAKLDRLARNVAFIANLRESGVDFIAADMPNANTFTVNIMASVAQQEGEMIAERTRKAMATAKARGTLLGRRDDAIAAFSDIGVKASAKVRGNRAAAKAKDLLPLIHAAKASGASSLRQIADLLNERDTPTAKSSGKWFAVQVARVLPDHLPHSVRSSYVNAEMMICSCNEHS